LLRLSLVNLRALRRDSGRRVWKWSQKKVKAKKIKIPNGPPPAQKKDKGPKRKEGRGLLGRLFSPGGVLLVAAAGGVANLIRQLQDELRAGSDDDDEADMRRSSPRTNLNLETTEHPTFVLNAEGKVVLWNSKAAAITGACVGACAAASPRVCESPPLRSRFVCLASAASAVTGSATVSCACRSRMVGGEQQGGFWEGYVRVGEDDHSDPLAGTHTGREHACADTCVRTGRVRGRRSV